MHNEYQNVMIAIVTRNAVPFKGHEGSYVYVFMDF